MYIVFKIVNLHEFFSYITLHFIKRQVGKNVLEGTIIFGILLTYYSNINNVRLKELFFNTELSISWFQK